MHCNRSYLYEIVRGHMCVNIYFFHCSLIYLQERQRGSKCEWMLCTRSCFFLFILVIWFHLDPNSVKHSVFSATYQIKIILDIWTCLGFFFSFLIPPPSSPSSSLSKMHQPCPAFGFITLEISLLATPPTSSNHLNDFHVTLAGGLSLGSSRFYPTLK